MISTRLFNFKSYAAISVASVRRVTICDSLICTVDIDAEFGDVRPLDEARMRTLTFNGAQLLDRIDPNHAFVTELATAGCITWPQRERIIDTVYTRDRNDKLLEFLTRRSVADFNKFINVLSKEQAHLVPLLVTDGSKTYLVNICDVNMNL